MHGKWLELPIILCSVSYTGNSCIFDGALATVARCVITNRLTYFSAATLVAICSTILSFSSSNISCVCMELMLLLVTEGSVEYKKLLEFTGTHAVIGIHRLQEITRECVTVNMRVCEHMVMSVCIQIHEMALVCAILSLVPTPFFALRFALTVSNVNLRTKKKQDRPQSEAWRVDASRRDHSNACCT